MFSTKPGIANLLPPAGPVLTANDVNTNVRSLPPSFTSSLLFSDALRFLDADEDLQWFLDVDSSTFCWLVVSRSSLRSSLRPTRVSHTAHRFIPDHESEEGDVLSESRVPALDADRRQIFIVRRHYVAQVGSKLLKPGTPSIAATDLEALILGSVAPVSPMSVPCPGALLAVGVGLGVGLGLRPPSESSLRSSPPSSPDTMSPKLDRWRRTKSSDAKTPEMIVFNSDEDQPGAAILAPSTSPIPVVRAFPASSTRTSTVSSVPLPSTVPFVTLPSTVPPTTVRLATQSSFSARRPSGRPRSTLVRETFHEISSFYSADGSVRVTTSTRCRVGLCDDIRLPLAPVPLMLPGADPLHQMLPDLRTGQDTLKIAPRTEVKRRSSCDVQRSTSTPSPPTRSCTP